MYFFDITPDKSAADAATKRQKGCCDVRGAGKLARGLEDCEDLGRYLTPLKACPDCGSSLEERRENDSIAYLYGATYCYKVVHGVKVCSNRQCRLSVRYN